MHLSDHQSLFCFKQTDADFGPNHFAEPDQFRYDSADEIDRNRKADSGALSRLAGDGRVDADQSAMRVEQRAAGISRIDRRVDLNDLLHRAVAANLQRAIEARHHAGCQRPLQAKRVADREALHADFQQA